MTGRATPEWIGKTAETAIPPRVKLRIWEREQGRCYLSGRKIMPGDAFQYEHVIALCNGGENRESNIRLALTEKHKDKTAADVAEKSKVARVKAKHLGLKKPSRMPGSRNSRFKQKIGGGVIDRETGLPV